MSDRLISDDLNPSTLSGYSLLREDCGVLDGLQRAIFEFRGEDRKAWIQGQITNEMRGVMAGSSLACCMCTPTGQLLANCTLWALENRYLVLNPIELREAVANRCESMIIMEDVQVADLTDSYRIVSIQGPEATFRLSEMFELPKLDAGIGVYGDSEVILLRSNRTGFGGWDLLVRSTDEKMQTLLTDQFARIDPEAYEIARLEAGIPRYGSDMNAKTLPPEMGQNFEYKNISYSKGCYTGQEVLMRMHSRGHTNRSWMALLADDPMPVGAVVGHRSRPDAGTVTSSVFSPRFGFIAGAMIRNEAAFDGEIVEVQSPDGPVEAEVRRMPLLRFD